MNLSYRHHFGFAVVGKLKLAALNPKVSIFCLTIFHIIFLDCFGGFFVFFFSFPILLGPILGLGLCGVFSPSEKVSLGSIHFSSFNFLEH